MKCNIYKITDGKYYYYGSTKRQLSIRLNEHRIKARKYVKRKMYKQFNKTRWKNVKIFVVRVLKVKTQKELLKIEERYISKYIGLRGCLNSIHAISSV